MIFVIAELLPEIYSTHVSNSLLCHQASSQSEDHLQGIWRRVLKRAIVK